MFWNYVIKLLNKSIEVLSNTNVLIWDVTNDSGIIHIGSEIIGHKSLYDFESAKHAQIFILTSVHCLK